VEDPDEKNRKGLREERVNKKGKGGMEISFPLGMTSLASRIYNRKKVAEISIRKEGVRQKKRKGGKEVETRRRGYTRLYCADGRKRTHRKVEQGWEHKGTDYSSSRA